MLSYPRPAKTEPSLAISHSRLEKSPPSWEDEVEQKTDNLLIEAVEKELQANRRQSVLHLSNVELTPGQTQVE